MAQYGQSLDKPAPCTGSNISSPAVPPLALIDESRAWIVETRAPALRCCASQGRILDSLFDPWMYTSTHRPKWGKTTWRVEGTHSYPAPVKHGVIVA